MSDLRKLANQSLHYFSGRVFTLALSFISFPILARILPVTEFGILNLVQPYVILGCAFGKMGLSNAMMRSYAENSSDEERLARLYSTLWFGALMAAVPTAALYGLSVAVMPNGWIQPALAASVIVSSPLVLVRSLQAIALTIVRVEERTLTFNVIDICTRALTVTAVVAFLLAWSRTSATFLVGSVVAEGCLLLVNRYFLMRRHLFSMKFVDWGLLRSSLAYSLPVMMSEVAYILLASSERTLVNVFLGAQQLGYYAAANGLASTATNTVLSSVSLAVLPLYVQTWTKKGMEATSRLFSELLHIFVLAACGVVAITASCSREIMVVLGSAKFEASHPMLAPLVLGSLIFTGNNLFLNAPFLLHKQTGRLAKLVGVAAAAKILLGLALLPAIGIWGAILSHVLGNAVLACLTGRISFRLIPISCRYGSWARSALIGLAVGLLVWKLRVGPLWLTLLVKGGAAMAMYSALVLAFEPRLRNLAAQGVGVLRKKTGV